MKLTRTFQVYSDSTIYIWRAFIEEREFRFQLSVEEGRPRPSIFQVEEVARKHILALIEKELFGERNE